MIFALLLHGYYAELFYANDAALKAYKF